LALLVNFEKPRQVIAQKISNFYSHTQFPQLLFLKKSNEHKPQTVKMEFKLYKKKITFSILITQKLKIIINLTKYHKNHLHIQIKLMKNKKENPH